MKTVLITGATGSVCMNLTELLLKKGQRVVMYARHPLNTEDEQELRQLPGELIFEKGDVLDAEALDAAVKKYGVTCIYHGAAMTPNADIERKQGKRILEVNVLGVVNVLDTAQKNNISRFIYMGSVSGYGNTCFEGKPLIEGVSVAKPNSLYELSKFTAERVVIRYRQLFAMKAYVARIGDVFGPWEHYTGVRPFMSFPYQTTAYAMEGKQIHLPRPCRQDWVYSRDIAESLYALMEAPNLKYDVYPLCSGYIWPLTDWCDLLKKKYPCFDYDIADKPENATIRVNQTVDNAPMSTERLVEDTGYVPKYDLEKAFKDYMDWLEAHPGYLFREK